MQVQDIDSRSSLVQPLVDSDSLQQQQLLPRVNHTQLNSIFFSQLDNVIQSTPDEYSSDRLHEALNASNFLPDQLCEQMQVYGQDIIVQLKQQFSRSFTLIGILKCVSVIFQFVVPILMSQLTASLSDSLSQFAIYSTAMLIATFLSAIFDTQYTFRIKQLEIECKAFLTENVYQSLGSKRSLDVMNIVNIDIGSVINFFISFHECWSLVLKLVIGMALLYIEIKEAVFYGMATATVLMLMNFAIARKIAGYFSQGLQFKDMRMKLLRDFASNPKAIKFLKWESKWQSKIQEVRNQEYRILRASKYLDALCVLFWAVTNTVISTTTLYVYTRKNELENVFTIIFLFSLLTNPLNSLPWTVAGMLQAKTSFKRINQFIYLPQPKTFIPQGIHISSCILKWDGNDEFILNIPHFRVDVDSLTFIIGSTSSGKSSFLYALMNQMVVISGEFEVNEKFSYVPQVHWLCSGTIRSNILMESPYDEQKYIKCLEASNLMQDLIELSNESTLSDQDLFEVGPDACKLSGGQKQRLSICRALYNQGDVLLLDDVFSSLDPHIADRVFNSLQSWGIPIVMVINDSYLQRYHRYATNIILMQQGQAILDQQQISEYINNEIIIKEISKEIPIVYKQSQQTTQQQLQQPQQQSIRFYLQMMGKFNCISIALSLILMQASFNVYDIWLNSCVNQQPYFIIGNSFVITILALTLIDFIIKAYRAFQFAYGNLSQATKIFKQLLKSVMYADAIFYDKEESGQILTRFSDDQNVVDHKFPFELNMLCNNIVNFIGTFIVLIILQWFLIVPTIISLLLFYRLQQRYRPTSMPLRRLEAQTNAILVTDIYEQYKGAQIIRIFNKQHAFKLKFMNSLKNCIRASWTSRVLSLWLQIRLQLVAGFIVFCILLFTICAKLLNIPVSESTLQLLLYYSLTKISLFRDLTLSMTTCEQELVSYERIHQYCIKPIEQDTNMLVSESNSISFEDVQLQYSDGNIALRGINFRIQQGMRVAFCGRTGSGKSSILSVLFQLYPETAGIVKVIDNTKFKWRNLIGVIPQNGFVFQGTLQDNVGNSEYVEWLLQQFNTSITLDSLIDPTTVSQGTRQLISFIRVMQEDCQVVCLDEATASVDLQIEDQMHRILKESGKTIITISHRLEQLCDYDMIFYLEDGIIRESGTFDQLVQLNAGFAALRNLG